VAGSERFEVGVSFVMFDSWFGVGVNFALRLFFCTFVEACNGGVSEGWNVVQGRQKTPFWIFDCLDRRRAGEHLKFNFGAVKCR